MNDELKLLVEWSSPWEEFVTAIRPALSRSPEPLDGEARSGLFPYRGMLAALAVEILLLIVAILLPAKLASMRAFQPAAAPKYDVIYFSGDELPQMEDAGGAKAGTSGRSGGREGHHATQVIRVSRGPSLREQVVDAPQLNLPHSDSAVANLLAYKSVPGPPPAKGLESTSRRAEMPMSAIPPPADVQHDNAHAVPSLEASVIAPSPSALQRELPVRRAPGSRVDVTPPPVSVPKEITNLHPTLTLPPSMVVPPAPDNLEHQIGSVNTRAGVQELQKQIVPPTEQAGSAVGDRRAVNSLGNSAVVAPPAQLANASGARRQTGSLGDAGVVPPPAQVSGMTHKASAGLGDASVVPPPAQLNGSTGRQLANGLSAGTAVVPPPPSASSGNSASGAGGGRRGPADATANGIAPPSNSADSGIVLSNKPGAKVGVPGTASPGSLAMSPAGGDKPGLGGSGGGAGISHGVGPGSSTSGEGSGAKTSGTGPGSNEIANKGISPFPGTGGAGKGGNAPSAMPGVSVSGGTNNVVTLPSFGSDGKPPGDPAHSSTLKNQQGPGITVVATSRSGGAFNYYGALKGDKVYTIYIDTVLGTAVMQFADPKSATQSYPEDLTAPLAIRADLPANLHGSRLVIACTLDRSGMVKTPHVVESESPELSATILAALPNWKFRPAFRGEQPIEVNAILGFDIDTR